MPDFSLTPRQQQGNELLASDAQHIMLLGGSRSGKTFLIVRAICMRAIKAPKSRHAILRFRFNHCKQSIVMDTFPKVMALAFPTVTYEINKSDWFATLAGGSEVWFGGLDDKERSEKVLGNEYCVDPDSRILTADLRWVPARDVKVGDELIGFPEDLAGHCKLTPAFVERADTVEAERLRVVTDKGTTIVSAEHRFVAHFDDRRHRNYRQFSWRMARDIKAGDKIRFAVEPWDVGVGHEDGWFAGILDGEGWCSAKSRNVGLAQREGTVLSAARAWLARNGVNYREHTQKGPAHLRSCVQLIACGMWEALRMLGISRPKRLDSRVLWDGVRAFRNAGHYATVQSIEPLGRGRVVSFSTTTKTLIADGFLGHNCTIFLNECSQISWASRNTMVTRLAQPAEQVVNGQKSPLKPRMYYDENPTDKAHWSYRLFLQKVDPDTKERVPRPDNFAWMRMNPADNAANLPAEYIGTLKDLPARLQSRFLEGEFRENDPSALFPDVHLDQWRVTDGIAPDMVRIVVAVDPSGSDEEDAAEHDEIGIAVAGLGVDGNGYMLEDVSVKAGPATWGRVVASAYERHKADRVVAEQNFGGAMVAHVIRTANPTIPVTMVNASRGKVIRAEPVSALCEKGKARMVGTFPRLEDELSGFTTHGYTGSHSPNRADAFVWAFSALFPALTRVEKPVIPALARPRRPSALA